MITCGPMVCRFPPVDQFGRWSRWRCPDCGHRYYVTLRQYWYPTFLDYLRWVRLRGRP